MVKIANSINGQLVEPASRSYLENFDPATGAADAHVPDSDGRDVEAAVDAATRAFPAWSRTPVAERSRLLLRIAELIDANATSIARAECVDTGKPIKLATEIDIPRSSANFRFFATAILHTHTEAHMMDSVAMNYTLRQPRGVAGLISPWNLPLYLLSWKIAPALATGNTAVAKPSELTPMTAFILSQLCALAGLPPGVLNIVHGLGAKVGAEIVKHPRVPAISFTGGTSTGRSISREAGPLFKRLSLELGGKNPNIIFADADMELAVAQALRAAFTNQGQICLCGSRLFVERAAYGAFIDRFVAGAKALRVGDPLDPATDQGALVSRAHLEKISAAVELAVSEGGKVLCGGRRAAPPNERCRNGFFYEPTVLAELSPHCRTQQDEIFGPVVSVTPFDGEDQAIEMANCTPYGLASMLWTRDLSRAHRVAERIQAGIVWINCWMQRDLRTPFGGMKESGVGREGGVEALRFFTEPKNVCVRL